MKPLYTTEALSVGEARDGRVHLADHSLDFDLAMPKEMGGSGEGTNPEQLFALGYAACFHSALKLVAAQTKADTTHSTVGARVSIGKNNSNGFELTVALEVSLPNVPMNEARKLAQKAHEVCPYSNATRGNIEVSVSVVEG